MKIMNLIKLALLALIAFAPMAHASKVIPVTGQPLHSSFSFDEAKALFAKAGARRGWVMKEAEGENKLIANIWVRKHFVSVLITINNDTYNIDYRDSENMKYKPDGTIHRKYNGWVKNLNKDIQRTLLAAN
jgi:hypothetical protein